MAFLKQHGSSMTERGLMPLRKDILILCAILLLLITGCATTEDVTGVRGELNYQIQSVNEKVADLERQLSLIREETRIIREDAARTKDDFAPIRTSLAEIRAEVTDVKSKLQQARGQIDDVREEMRKESRAFAAKTVKREESEKSLREKIDGLVFKLNFLENFLGINKKEEQNSSPDGNGKANALPELPLAQKAGSLPVSEQPKMDKSALYSAAFAFFKEGKYDKAREGFANLLTQYPSTEFSDNAIFWLGECYYFEKKYEKAIVEYDKVIKNYPGSNKVSYALLKQGLSFLKLGDKESARLLLQQVTKDYPNTSQARIARAKILEIK